MGWVEFPVDIQWVPYPQEYAAVMASAGKNWDEGPLRFWKTDQHGSVIDLDFSGDGVRFHRKIDWPWECTGRDAYVRFDPKHPQCGVCRKFIRRRRGLLARSICWSCDDGEAW